MISRPAITAGAGIRPCSKRNSFFPMVVVRRNVLVRRDVFPVKLECGSKLEQSTTYKAVHWCPSKSQRKLAKVCFLGNGS